MCLQQTSRYHLFISICFEVKKYILLDNQRHDFDLKIDYHGERSKNVLLSFLQFGVLFHKNLPVALYSLLQIRYPL
jgi:hypothetical protein